MKQDTFSEKFPPRPCPVCDGKECALLFRQEFASLSQGSFLEGYHVVVCRSCGLAFADRIPPQAAFDEHYRSMSKYEYQNSCGAVSPFDLQRFRSIAATLIPFLPGPDARILDVGCATGALLGVLKERGYPRVLGLDPSSECAATARRLHGVEVRDVSLAALHDAGERFDCLILSGVLEHIHDLPSLLSSTASLLERGGFLFVEVPDATGFALCPDAPYQEFSVEHINFFSATSLKNLLAGYGFAESLSLRGQRHQSANTVMPVVSAVFRYKGQGAEGAFHRDDETEVALREYIRQSQLVESMVHRTVERLVEEGMPIIVWGVGTHTLRLLQTSRLAEANIRAFVDSNPRYQQKSLSGLPIISPSELPGRSESILISSRVFQREIENQIVHELGLPNQVLKIYGDL